MSFNIVSCLLLFFVTFSSYSAGSSNENSDREPIGRCEIQFLKPKQIKYLSPEQIRLLGEEMTHIRQSSPEQAEQIRSEGSFGFGTREVLHSLHPKHLFFKGQKKGEWGDLKWTKEQFHALDLNLLHPQTREYILTREDVASLLSEAQVQELDLHNISPGTLRFLMSSPLAANLRKKFQELKLYEWPQEDLEPFSQDPLLAQYMSESQIKFMKEQRFLTQEELAEEEKYLNRLRNKNAMEDVKDHSIFDQAIDEGSFEWELVPFLRISELNDQSVDNILNIIYVLAIDEEEKELSNHVFDNLSNKNVITLAQRSPRDFEADYWNKILPHLKDHSLYDEKDSVFLVLYQRGILTDDSLEHVLSERLGLLNGFNSRIIGQIPKDTLRNIVFGDKSSELSKDTFEAALKASLEVDEGDISLRKSVYLTFDQIERLIKNPYFMSHDEFEEIRDDEKSTWFRIRNIYKNSTNGKEAPEDFKDGHLTFLKKRLKSILGFAERVSLFVFVEGHSGKYKI